jgi:hypothetical protein
MVMMTFSATVKALIATKKFTTFSCIEIRDRNNGLIKNVTNNPYDITLSDSSTYLSDGTLLSIDPPQMNSSVDREQYKISFADPNFAEGEYASDGLIGSKVKNRLCFIGSDGYPLTSIADTVLVYAGRVDGTAYVVKTGTTGEAILQITCASPMADLDYKKGLITSKDFVRGRNSDDSSCDMVYGGSGVLQLRWGKT